MKKDAVVGPKTTASDLVKRGHCRPMPTGVDTKVGRVRFSFDVSKLPPDEVVNAFLAEHAPPVLDPFAGGGSIPLEAQRGRKPGREQYWRRSTVLIGKAACQELRGQGLEGWFITS